jgi:prevent-host-death family protein
MLLVNKMNASKRTCHFFPAYRVTKKEMQAQGIARFEGALIHRVDRLDNVASWSYIDKMKTMGIRELKNRLSEVIRAVKAGERILVTDRGAVVAELAPLGRRATDPSVPPGLARLAERGVARLGAPNDPTLYRNLPRLRRKPTYVARLLDEERGSR